MKKTQDMWICNMAETLVCEVIEQMSGIRLSLAAGPEQESEQKQMEGVCALIGGDYTFDVHFFAERSLFHRFARNMIGAEPSEEDVRDYAVEFFNTLCGRFISEIINETHIKEHLMPIKYEVSTEWENIVVDKTTQSLFFISDEQEYTAFSWTAMPIEEMLRRNYRNE